MGEENNLEPEGTEPDAAPSDGDENRAGTSVPSTGAKALTPGQRLAAKKAQKAQQKQDFKSELKRQEEAVRAKELEEAQSMLGGARAEPALPEEVQKVAGDFTDFVQSNRSRILTGLGGFVVICGAVVLGQHLFSAGSAEQASLLAAAVETSTAPIDAEDADGKNDDGKPVFKSAEDRAKKAALAYAAVAKADPKSAAGTWAKLAEGALKLELDKADEARALYQGVYDQHKDGELGARALEGLAISLEAGGKTDEALKRYEELKASSKDLAEYHIARIKLAKGDRDGAKALLKPLYDRLSERAEGMPPSRYLKGEVEIRLAEIDSSLVDKGTSEGEPQFSQEELQRLIEQLRSKGNLPAGDGAE